MKKVPDETLPNAKCATHPAHIYSLSHFLVVVAISKLV